MKKKERENLIEQKEIVEIEDENEDDDTPKDALWNLLKTFRNFAILALIIFLIHEFGIQRNVVNGKSMENVLQDQDSVLVDKFSYRFSNPQRYDIVLFPYEKQNGEKIILIKRIIGLPGEKVCIKKGAVYINGKKLEDDYGIEPIKDSGYAKTSIQLDDDSYFVLGDNRNNSVDSRSLDRYGIPVIGQVKKEKIIGKAFFRVYPFNSFGELD